MALSDNALVFLRDHGLPDDAMPEVRAEELAAAYHANLEAESARKAEAQAARQEHIDELNQISRDYDAEARAATKQPLASRKAMLKAASVRHRDECAAAASKREAAV